MPISDSVVCSGSAVLREYERERERPILYRIVNSHELFIAIVSLMTFLRGWDEGSSQDPSRHTTNSAMLRSERELPSEQTYLESFATSCFNFVDDDDYVRLRVRVPLL